MAKHHSVYVVELGKAVLEKRQFIEANPGYDPAKACFYVGMTGIDPRERFKNHKRGYKASRWVKDYGVRLRPSLYEHLNPMTYEQAQKKEPQLARELRAKGHGVWQN